MFYFLYLFHLQFFCFDMCQFNISSCIFYVLSYSYLYYILGYIMLYNCIYYENWSNVLYFIISSFEVKYYLCHQWCMTKKLAMIFNYCRYYSYGEQLYNMMKSLLSPAEVICDICSETTKSKIIPKVVRPES